MTRPALVPMCRTGLAVACLLVWLVPSSRARAQTPQFQYRVVFASHRQLQRQLDDAGREGYSCVSVARTEPGIGVPGVVVVLGRPAGSPPPSAEHRVVVAGWAGTDLQPPLERDGADGFRVCGAVLDEEAPNPALVVVMRRETPASGLWHYRVEVLNNYKNSLLRLNEAARTGFAPVAVATVNDNRVPEVRSWLVITERADKTTAPNEVVVRSSSGADGFERALNERGSEGFRVDAIWKEGNDAVAMMSRPVNGPRRTFTYAAESSSDDRIHSLSGRYLGDVPYLTSGARLIVSDRSVPASNEVVEDPLPPPGALGFAAPLAMEVLGDHISRNRGFEPVFAIVRRGPRDGLVLRTIVSRRAAP